jgi:type IV secretion system protein TrbL
MPDIETPNPQSRTARLKILLPIALVVAGLALFLALFWHPGHGHKGHARSAASRGEGSPVGGSGETGNSGVTGGGSGGSPVGGGPSRARSGNKAEGWWYRKGDNEGKNRRGNPEDAWWSPKKGGSKTESDGESPVGGSSGGSSRGDSKGSADLSEAQSPRERDKPARASSGNPGEVAGQKGGPDDFWWRN